jgi:hypothetical protein
MATVDVFNKILAAVPDTAQLPPDSAISSKQTTIEHNFISDSYSYMFRLYGVIIRLNFGAH